MSEGAVSQKPRPKSARLQKQTSDVTGGGKSSSKMAPKDSTKVAVDGVSKKLTPRIAKKKPTDISKGIASSRDENKSSIKKKSPRSSPRDTMIKDQLTPKTKPPLVSDTNPAAHNEDDFHGGILVPKTNASSSQDLTPSSVSVKPSTSAVNASSTNDQVSSSVFFLKTPF